MVQQNGLKQFSRLKYARALNTSGLFLHKLMYKHTVIQINNVRVFFKFRLHLWTLFNLQNVKHTCINSAIPHFILFGTTLRCCV